MSIKSQLLTGKYLRELKTEILFFVAAAKASGDELIILDVKSVFGDERDLKRVDSAARVLKELKRQGRIQLFLCSSDFDSSFTELEYLKNKYPSIIDIKSDEIFFVIKM